MNSRELLQLYQAGQSEAATAIFDRYVARLVALARSRITQKLRPRIDAEDVVQSAYRSFFVHAKENEYQLNNSGDLWRLLASIALHKLHRQIEKQTAGKRSVDREIQDPSIGWVTGPEPSPAETVAVVEELQLVLKTLTPDEQRVLTSMLQGSSLEEVSRTIGKSERTARRLLDDIKHKIEGRLLDDRPGVNEPHVTDADAPLRYSDYVLEQLISSGGMGKVFRATEKSTGKQVAIKALHKARQSEGRAVARFVQEAHIVSNLSHPNIVDVEGLGRFPSGGYFLVMRFVDGRDLQSRLQDGALPLSEVLRIVKQVAGAVQFAHDHGVVHCDLKPGNVLLDKHGQVFVTDFGFAFLMTGDSAIRHGAGGTAGYLAPEILRYKSQPTPAADIYALGMLMWTLSTGKPPMGVTDEQMKHELAAPIYPTCRRCIEDDPKDRYQSATDLVKVLDEFSSLL